MKTLLLGMACLLLFPILIERGHQVIFCQGRAPMALVNVPYCDVYCSSRIYLIKSYIGDSDSIIVDGKECTS